LKAANGIKMKQSNVLNVPTFLDSARVTRAIRTFRAKEPIFSQGDTCKDVMYIQKGSVKLSVVSNSGRKVIVAILKPGDFVGEGGLAGQSAQMATATAATAATILVISLKEMIRVLHSEHAFSDRFITYALARNIQIQDDLIHQLFNSSEKRLARTLLLLARYGKHTKPQHVLLKVTPAKLAKMIGITQSRVNFFMKNFEKLGFINRDSGLRVNDSLLSVVLHD
jgi:CRP/FNR family transcriptional regulator, cyclic AMP receptor protein